jgi:hypothetical protein
MPRVAAEGGEGLSRALYEADPVRLFALTGLVAKQRPLIGKGENLADPDLGFVPLEDKKLAGLQHTEALGEPIAKVVAPVVGEDSILESQPAFTTGAHQVGRVEDNHVEACIGERQVSKVHDDVWLNLQHSTITKHMLFVTDVTEQSALVALSNHIMRLALHGSRTCAFIARALCR